MSEQKMFRKGEPRYFINGIEARLPVMYQIFIWDIIDGSREQGQEIDYLQVFELEVYEIETRIMLKIIHSQEMPGFSRIYRIPIKKEDSINGKIYVIDEITHATVLWAEEY